MDAGECHGACRQRKEYNTGEEKEQNTVVFANSCQWPEQFLPQESHLQSGVGCSERSQTLEQASWQLCF